LGGQIPENFMKAFEVKNRLEAVGENKMVLHVTAMTGHGPYLSSARTKDGISARKRAKRKSSPVK
jgi:hypothetical protein